MIIEEKNRQIEIDEKPANPGGTEEENRSAGNKLRCLRLLVPSAGCSRSTALSFGSFGKRNHQRSSHRRSGVGRRRGRCWLVGVILVEGTEQLPEVLCCRCRLPGVLLLGVTLLEYQVIETW